MPTYVYEREDGSTFEIEQRITENALEKCPTTGQKVARKICAPLPIFKGSGFYQTDYKGSNSASTTKASSSESSKSTASDSTPSKKCGSGCGCH